MFPNRGRIRIYSPNGHPHSRLVQWGLLLADDITTRHAAKTIARGDSRGCHGSLPLADYVVGLVGVEGGPVGDVRSCCDECADVSHGYLGGLGESEHEEAGDDAKGVEGDEGASEAQFIGCEGRDDHGDHSVIVRLRDERSEASSLGCSVERQHQNDSTRAKKGQTLNYPKLETYRNRQQNRLVRIESHAPLQDDRQEIRQRRRHQVQQEKQTPKTINLHILEAFKDPHPRELLRFQILTIILNPLCGNIRLLHGQKLEALPRILRKVDHPPVRHDAQDTSGQSLDQIHPPPTSQPRFPMQMVETEIHQVPRREDGHFARLQEGESKLLLPAQVPRANQVCQAGVDTRHGDTQKHTEGNHLAPGMDERRAEGQQTKGERDRCEPQSRTEEAYCDGAG